VAGLTGIGFIYKDYGDSFFLCFVLDETAEVFEDLGSEVDKYIFEGSFHGIDDYEIERASEIISSE